MTANLQGFLMCRDFLTRYPFTAPPLNGKSAPNAKFVFNEMVGRSEQSSGSAGAQPETQTAGPTGLLSALYPLCGGPARGFLCGICFRVTRTEIGGKRHLWRKHGLRIQLELFPGGSLAAGADENSRSSPR